jgi:Flp pilus assembly protein TadB
VIWLAVATVAIIVVLALAYLVSRQREREAAADRRRTTAERDGARSARMERRRRLGLPDDREDDRQP